MNGRTVTQPKSVENYRPLLLAATGLALLLFLGMGLFWVGEGNRLASSGSLLAGERVANGQALYQAQCAGCHGQQGEGGVGLPLNDPAVLKNTPDGVFISIIRSGVPQTQMPAWSVDFGGPLTDEDIRSVMAFIRSWQK